MRSRAPQNTLPPWEDTPSYTHARFLRKELRFDPAHPGGTPTTKCDLVMKGGIASGIVYPPAVVELATQYRFGSIGGTSAGAIAAAATAAAELGRQKLLRVADLEPQKQPSAANQVGGGEPTEEALLNALLAEQGVPEAERPALRGELQGRTSFVGLNALSRELRGEQQKHLIYRLFANSAPYRALPLLNLIQDVIEPSWYQRLLGSIRWLDEKLRLRRGAAEAEDVEAGWPLAALRWALLPLRVLLFLARSLIGTLFIVWALARRDWLFFWLAAALSFYLTYRHGVQIVAILSQIAGVFGLTVASAVGDARPSTLVALIPHAVVAIIAGVAGSTLHLLWVLLRTVPSYYFGICTGLSRQQWDRGPLSRLHAWVRRQIRLDAASEPGLTDWLAAWCNNLAGRAASAAPVTCADLQEAGVEFRVVTTNLSQRRPYVLPFDLEGLERFVFSRPELERFFPKSVVAHMVARSAAVGHPTAGFVEAHHLRLPEGYHFVPSRNDLPLVVALRMSLSLPGVISAVPLYRLSARAQEGIAGARQRGEVYQVQPADLQRHLFSDGGIASNFPIHFFDRWLPNSPTFAISTVTLPSDAIQPKASSGVGATAQGAPGAVTAAVPTSAIAQLAQQEVSADYVVASPERTASGPLAGAAIEQGTQPDASARGVPVVELGRADKSTAVEWDKIAQVPDFVGAIIDTMMNYRDNLQAGLPSYRERIARIRLSATEGGLNLKMSPHTVRQVQLKGLYAGAKLFPRGQPSTSSATYENGASGKLVGEFDFDEHWWVRFRLLMCELETHLLTRTADPGNDHEICERLARAIASETLAFSLPRDRAKGAQARLDALLQLINGWRAQNKEDAGLCVQEGSGGGEPRFFEPPGITDDDASLRVTPSL